VSSSSVAGGASATGTVGLNVPAPAGGALVSLFSSNPAAASMPASVTIPEGQTSVSFAISTTAQQTTAAVSLGATWSGSQQAVLFNVLGTRGGAALQPAPQSFDLEPASLSPVAVGQEHLNIFVTWDGALQALTPSISSGSLPAGMILRPFNAVAYVITGVPTTQQTKAFVLKFTAANGAAWGVPIVWQVGPPAPIHISGGSIPDGVVGQPYDGGFFFGGGVAPYRWSISAGTLPNGLKINSTTSEISGTPQVRGTFDFTVRLTDSIGEFLDIPETVVIS
jgi:hypothetical protein